MRIAWRMCFRNIMEYEITITAHLPFHSSVNNELTAGDAGRPIKSGI